ncbi:hypothetical protein [Candidatus Uabimicrobium sp. HlEnr_7]|uniref:hypothetical protein n=1 Tax=Candidatus Uabimicrobium helgolandensis TaxID=3095367 RepID=UPI00355779BD
MGILRKILIKETTIQTLFLQARKIACHHCSKPFTYIVTKKGKTTDTSLRFLAPDDNDLKKHMNKRGLRLAKKKKLGEALCPHCKRYQNWMITKSRLSLLPRCWLIMFIFVITILSFTLDSRTFSSFLGLAILLGLTTVLAMGLAVLLGITSGVQSERDNRAKDSERLAKLITECEASQADPVEVWYFHHMGMELTETDASVSLGFVDLTVPDQVESI